MCLSASLAIGATPKVAAKPIAKVQPVPNTGPVDVSLFEIVDGSALCTVLAEPITKNYAVDCTGDASKLSATDTYDLVLKGEILNPTLRRQTVGSRVCYIFNTLGARGYGFTMSCLK